MDEVVSWLDYYCEEHKMLASIRNCYCGRQGLHVVVKVFKRGQKKDAN